MLLETAKRHFDEDIARARALHAQSGALGAALAAQDVLRAAWMMAVGACDAYFCDAYADLIARTLRAREIEPAVNLPDRLNNLKLPVIAIIRPTGGWRWRMAARELIEKESILSIEQIKSLFNQFFRKKSRPLSTDTIEGWILDRRTSQRHFGINRTAYRTLTPAGRGQAKTPARDHFDEHYGRIFQRRHDCIHNCDRPKSAIKPMSATHCEKAIYDCELLVTLLHEALCNSYKVYLQDAGFRASTRNRVVL